MTLDEKPQGSESTKATETKPPLKTPDKNSTKKQSGVKKIFRQIGFGFLFFLLGALVVGLALYLPANSKLRNAEVELERLYQIESTYEDLVVDHERVSIQRSVYKILANASQMHVAIVNNDTDRISQYLQYIEDDLASLSIPDFPDLPTSLQDQLSKVAEKRTNDKTGALEALRVFENDLLLLIDNLE